MIEPTVTIGVDKYDGSQTYHVLEGEQLTDAIKAICELHQEESKKSISKINEMYRESVSQSNRIKELGQELATEKSKVGGVVEVTKKRKGWF